MALVVHQAVDNLLFDTTDLLDSTKLAQSSKHRAIIFCCLRNALINAVVGANVCGSRLFMLVFCFTIDIAAKMTYTVAD